MHVKIAIRDIFLNPAASDQRTAACATAAAPAVYFPQLLPRVCCAVLLYQLPDGFVQRWEPDETCDRGRLEYAYSVCVCV